MSDDLIATARRAKGSEILPTVSFGVLNAETLILRMADRIEALTEQLEAARLDAKEAEAYSVRLEAMRAKAATFLDNLWVNGDIFGVELNDLRKELMGDKP